MQRIEHELVRGPDDMRGIGARPTATMPTEMSEFREMAKMLRALWCWIACGHAYPQHAWWQQVRCRRCCHWKMDA